MFNNSDSHLNSCGSCLPITGFLNCPWKLISSWVLVETFFVGIRFLNAWILEKYASRFRASYPYQIFSLNYSNFWANMDPTPRLEQETSTFTPIQYSQGAGCSSCLSCSDCVDIPWVCWFSTDTSEWDFLFRHPPPFESYWCSWCKYPDPPPPSDFE